MLLSSAYWFSTCFLAGFAQPRALAKGRALQRAHRIVKLERPSRRTGWTNSYHQILYLKTKLHNVWNVPKWEHVIFTCDTMFCLFFLSIWICHLDGGRSSLTSPSLLNYPLRFFWMFCCFAAVHIYADVCLMGSRYTRIHNVLPSSFHYAIPRFKQFASPNAFDSTNQMRTPIYERFNAQWITWIPHKNTFNCKSDQNFRENEKLMKRMREILVRSLNEQQPFLFLFLPQFTV